MQPTDRGREFRQYLQTQATLRAIQPVDPPRFRSDAALSREGGIPLTELGWDATSRDIAQTRARQVRTATAIGRAPALATYLGDGRGYSLAADDLGPLSAVITAIERRRRGLAGVRAVVGAGAAVSTGTREMPRTTFGRVVQGLGMALGQPGLALSAHASEAAAEGGRTIGQIGYNATMSLTSGVYGALASFIEPFALPDSAGPDIAGSVGGWLRGQSEAGRHAIVPHDTGSGFVDTALQGVESVPLSLAALVAASRGNPRAGLAMFGAVSGGAAYTEARGAGMSPIEALPYAWSIGGLEVLGEALPIFRYVEDVARGSGFVRTLGRQLFFENVGEQFTAHSQDFTRWMAIEANQGKTFGEYVNERPRVAWDTFVATTAAVGLQTSGARGFSRAIRDYGGASQAQIDARNIDRVMAGSAESRLRRESPEDFQELLEQQLQGQPGESVYIPAEAVRSLFQSSDEMREDAFWAPYADEVSEAQALNGDVVIPLAEIATRLAGTQQWEELKDHIRTAAGGMSRAEATDINEAFAEALRQSGEELEADLAAERVAMEPTRKVFEAMRDKLMLAGFRADAANQLATLFTQRQATRASRLGRELTGQEADAIEVRQVLPRRLARAITAAPVPDAGLRDVIAEMRRGRGARSETAQFGPSLLDWIASQGGIEDRGGDLKAMGLASIKGKARKGERKLIRPHDDQAQLLGGQEFHANSPDDLALRAWEAGYFPEFSDRPSVNDLLDAISEGISGRERFASNESSDEDNLRMAAQELIALLDQQGLDHEKASDAEIVRTVSQYQSERAKGRSYGQSLFDDPEQPARTMTAAQRSELEARQQQSMARRGGQQSVKDQDGGLFSSDRDQDSLFQSYGDGPRGRITFTADGRSVIDLFAARDMSTAIHELGHHYLEEMKVDALLALEMDTAEARKLFADWETIKAWFAREGHAVAEDGTIPTEAHELFARGFERYAMEGKAPSSTLKRAFQAFKSWLINIYKAGVDQLNAPITPEIRDVMARMMATDEEIAAAAEEQRIKLGFDSAAQAGMTDKEFAAYQAAAAEATDEAHSELLKRVMAKISAAKTKQYREQEAGARAEIAAAIDEQPIFRALRLLRIGKLGDEDARTIKLDRQILIDIYGPLDLMPKGVPPIYADANTFHPDVIAEEVGFASGDEMIRALMDHEAARKELRAQGDKRSPRTVAIDEGTSQAMSDRYGDPLNDGTIEEEARARIHNDKQGEVFATELRALGRQTGRRSTPYEIARSWAAERIAGGKVVDVASGAAIQQYSRSARKAAKAFEEALLTGDKAEAFKQKHAQMLNNALVSEATKAKDKVDVAVRRLGRAAKRRTLKSTDQDYLEQAQTLLAQVELGQRSQDSIDEQQTFEAFAEEQRKLGIDIVVPSSFAASLGTTHWSRLSVEQLLGLDQAVAQILHLGRNAQSLLDGMERRAFQESKDELEAAADGAGKGRKVSALNDPSRSLPERAKSKIRWVDAVMLKVETLCDWLDKGQSNGPWNRMVFKPLADAQGRQGDLMRSYIEKINALIKAVPRKQAKDWGRKVETPELPNKVSSDPSQRGQPSEFQKDQIILMALNWGNAGNRQRLADGYGWQEAQVSAVLDRLMTAEDWSFVQGVWDTVEGLKAPLFEMHRRVNGVEPDTVEAVPVETPFGTFRGGYFPAVYDPQYFTPDMIEEVSKGKFSRVSTAASATKERASRVKRPILLSMSVITNHMREVIHDITHREAVIQVSKILSSAQIRNAVDRALGPEYLAAMDGWLEDVARPNAQASNRILRAIESAGRLLHKSVTLTGLGFRVSTVIVQPLGLANLKGIIGERAVLEGMATFMAGQRATHNAVYDEVTSRSAEMRDRFSTMDASIADMYEQHGSKLRQIGPKGLAKYAFHGILYADLLITTGGWIGAFNKGLREGMTEEDAAYYADKAIRTSQGSGAPKDRSAVLRASKFVGAFIPFFTYLNAHYNQQRDIGRRVRNTESVSGAAETARRAWWIMLVPGLLMALVRGDGPDEDDEESWAAYLSKAIVIDNLSTLPGVGALANAVGNGWGYRATALQSSGEGIVRAAGDIKAIAFDPNDEDDPSSSWIKNMFTTIGFLTGQPLSAPGAAVQFLADAQSGEVEPEGVGDWYEGLTTGRIREE